ncbi:MAG: cytochrome c biogenesis protein [Akkermansiaceae bacterium]
MSQEVKKGKGSKLGRWIAFVLMLVSIGGYGLYTMRINVSQKESHTVDSYESWEEAVVDVSRDMAIQDGGRVKPFSTWAGFTMLKLHGDRDMKIIVEGKTVKLSAEEVLLDCLFRPDLARQLPVFRIDDKEVLASLAVGDLPPEVRRMAGMAPSDNHEDLVNEVVKGKHRRDRYTYNELEPITPILLARAQKIRKEQPDKNKMTSNQRHTVDLAETAWLFMQLIYHMDFVRADIEVQEGTPAMDTENMRRMSYWLKSWPVLRKAVQEMNPDNGQMPPKLMALFSDLELRVRRASEDIGFVPAYDPKEDEWLAMGQRMTKVIENDRTYAQELIADMAMLEDANIALREKGQGTFSAELDEWKKSVHGRLDAKLVAKLGSEVKYGKWNYFYNALIIFLIAFFFVMCSWLSPRSLGAKICTRIAAVLTVGALLLMIAGIVHRCIIMERSPVGNLYDTILFIGTTGVLVLLLTELMTKRMVALGLSVFMGMACMFLARRYEMGDAKDHMDPLVAVLKSNFWLSTHVVTVTIGYMGGLAAAGLSSIYLFARVLGIDEGDKKWRRAMTRIAYGMVCFTLFFSLIGTVLGGIWANDSWGRFWGWDPKENGALMIVLWCLVILHARLAGYLREWGIHIAAVFGATIVAFSWWHVNSLGTGLHSYGFIDGLGAIWWFYRLMWGICIMGFIAAFVTRKPRSPKAIAKPPSLSSDKLNAEASQ